MEEDSEHLLVSCSWLLSYEFGLGISTLLSSCSYAYFCMDFLCRVMHQCKSIYIGKIVISNQVEIKLKSKSMDYVDV